MQRCICSKKEILKEVSFFVCPHYGPQMRAGRAKMAVLPAPRTQNACKKVKNSSFTRNAAPKCVQESQNQRFYPHRSPQMRAGKPKSAVLPALRPPNACRKGENGGFTRTAAPKCVQEGRKWQFYPHCGPQMRARRPKSAVLPALRPPNACKKGENGGFTRTAGQKCVQEWRKWQFYPHRSLKMRAER